MSKAKNFLEVIFNWIKSSIYLFLFIIVAAAFSYYYFIYSKNSQENFEFYTTTRTTLSESVLLTGRVKPSEEASLSFEKSGIVKNVNFSVGDKVLRGETIATLSGDDAYARVLEAAAALKAQKAILEDMTTGSRQETVDIKKSIVEKNKTDLEQAYKNAGDTLKNISISGNTLVRDNFNTYFSGSKTEGYRISVTSCDANLESQINNARLDAEKALTNIETFSASFSVQTTSEQERILSEVKNKEMKVISTYLDLLKSLFSSQCLTVNSTYDSVRLTITTSRNSWSGLSSDISSKINLLNTAKSVLSQSENDLKISLSGEKSEKIKQQEANVSAASARLTQANADSNKNLIKAPFTGIITNIDIKKGELVSPGLQTISLISTSNFEIESKVSEVDVAKLQTGSSAKVTFDAYGDQAFFEASISNISPAGIISDGVPTYKTIFAFINQDERIRSGMTANIEVVTKVHEDVVSVPAKYILNDKTLKKVKVKNGNSIEEKVVTTGVRGVNGEVEITSGLVGGEVVVLEREN